MDSLDITLILAQRPRSNGLGIQREVLYGREKWLKVAVRNEETEDTPAVGPLCL